VTGLAKTRHVGTNYMLSFNKSALKIFAKLMATIFGIKSYGW